MQYLFAIILTIGLLGSASAATLAPEHEMQRLLIVAEENIQNSRYAQAREALDGIAALNIEPAARYFYFRGLVEANTGNTEAAENALVEYVNRSGSEGEYYQESLRLITDLETAPAPSEQSRQDIDWSQVVVSQNDQYLGELKSLYLTNDDRKALVEHINSILAANTYVPGRIRKLNENEGLHYKISTNNRDDLVLQETDYTNPENTSHNLTRIAVFGVDPYVRGDCDFDRRSCWLWHPVEPQERWITIAENQAALQELSRAMTQLIRLLQK